MQFVLYCDALCYEAKIWIYIPQQDKTGVINDPLGQPTVPAGSDCRLILKFWDGRTLCVKIVITTGRSELWSASWIKKGALVKLHCSNDLRFFSCDTFRQGQKYKSESGKIYYIKKNCEKDMWEIKFLEMVPKGKLNF